MHVGHRAYTGVWLNFREDTAGSDKPSHCRFIEFVHSLEVPKIKIHVIKLCEGERE